MNNAITTKKSTISPQLIHVAICLWWSCRPTTHNLSHEQVVAKIVGFVVVITLFIFYRYYSISNIRFIIIVLYHQINIPIDL